MKAIGKIILGAFGVGAIGVSIYQANRNKQYLRHNNEPNNTTVTSKPERKYTNLGDSMEYGDSGNIKKVKFQRNTIFAWGSEQAGDDGYTLRHVAWNDNGNMYNGKNLEPFPIGTAQGAFEEILKKGELTETGIKDEYNRNGNRPSKSLIKNVNIINEAQGIYEVEYYKNDYYKNTLHESNFMRFDFETKKELSGEVENSKSSALSWINELE